MQRKLLVACSLLAWPGLPLTLNGGCAPQPAQSATALSAPARPAVTSKATQTAFGDVTVTRQQNVIYGQKDGMALTLDIFRPAKPNGIAVLWMVSGGWYSSHAAIGVPLSRDMILTLAHRGYTVFAVVHSSIPKYTIPEMLPDTARAVRFVRYHAKRYHIDTRRIGITGASSGGHLTLMQAMCGDDGDNRSKDPVERTSSRVQAAACFFPPTDFLNYGSPGESGLGCGRLKAYAAPFAFHAASAQQLNAIGRSISPIDQATASAPPTLIVQGDSDVIVPLQQAIIMIDKLHQLHVPAQLTIKDGVGHGWPDISRDMPKIADWFDKYLLAATPASGNMR